MYQVADFPWRNLSLARQPRLQSSEADCSSEIKAKLVDHRVTQIPESLLNGEMQ